MSVVDVGKRDLFNLEFEPGDRAILEAIAKEDSSRSMGATLRRLIRDEARRRGLVQPAQEPIQS
jgi:hypothetical protein